MEAFFNGKIENEKKVILFVLNVIHSMIFEASNLVNFNLAGLISFCRIALSNLSQSHNFFIRAKYKQSIT